MSILREKMIRDIKDKFLYYLEKAYDKEKLKFEDKIRDFGKVFSFKKMLHILKYTKWVVYCKHHFQAWKMFSII